MSRRARIAVVDYGMGNLRSVAKALAHVGADVEVTAEEGRLRRADGLVIVGVGAFPEAMRRLGAIRALLAARHAEATPMLGICLGLELFFDGSDEHDGTRGLGFIPGEVRRLETGGAKLPHIGWNRVRWERESELLDGLPDECPFYHVHSYAAVPRDQDVILGSTEYGCRFVSAVQRGSLFGVQFHPEKSSTHGLTLLKSFARVCLGTARPVRPVPARESRPGLCKRIIPCLDVDRGRVVKGTNFVDLRDAGDPVELAAFYDREGADEITFLDISATHEKRDTIAELAREAVDKVFVPITIGGGIRTVADAQTVLDAGADTISVNSAAVARPALLGELDAVFADQNLILAVDVKRRAGGGWDVYVAGGRTAAGRDALEWAQEGVARGAGQILITSMDRDGTKGGYDIELLTQLGEAVSVPIIASGGAGTLEHLTEALEAGADAVLCASIFHYGNYRVEDVKNHIAAHGIMVRPIDAGSEPGPGGGRAAVASASR